MGKICEDHQILSREIVALGMGGMLGNQVALSGEWRWGGATISVVRVHFFIRISKSETSLAEAGMVLNWCLPFDLIFSSHSTFQFTFSY